MLTWSGNTSGNARRRRRPRRRLLPRTRPRAQLIVPIAIPMALGLTFGLILAQSGGAPRLATSAAEASATPSASASATPSTNAANASTTPTNMNCELIVPPNPLTATGLATPYQLTGPNGEAPAASGCTQANPNLQAFVQATILNPATGKLWVYEPLVITLGSTPAIAPTRPKLPRNAVVNLMFGFNGNNLQLVGQDADTLSQANCVTGLDGSLFGQVSYCNSVPFYAAADRDIKAGKLRIPRAGLSKQTGQPCPTTRSFQLVDQDPSDNVTTKYLLTATGQTAQESPAQESPAQDSPAQDSDSPANAAALQNATPISNGSDNTLLDNFILPALGCKTFTAPDLSDAGRPGTSQTLDELSAAANQRAPIALVPENDPMTLVNGSVSRPKTNLYRLGVGQPLVEGADNEPFGDSRVGAQQAADTPANFCANLLNIQTPFLSENQSRFSASPSPVPATGNNLFTFMAARLSASFTNLGCAAFGLKNTVTLTQNAQGVTTYATFSLVAQAPQNQQNPQATPTAPATPVFPAIPTAVPLPTGWFPWTPWGDQYPGY
jgi:hypothetical protein